ncbi:hypothetical protein N6H05_10745 [Sphingobium sp. WTD-1]|uniref:hypothetical protein n=1 Tax=Sphingobium sp. WTD-1 TaxID=2979467 RepID=UPI0024DE4E82|nr:hypothetical protein [Sphingobium sp. WTD-1]WIA58243.1 hypothetical protein N6H05_10745 [Sphingobium sp. WTD-1]
MLLDNVTQALRNWPAPRIVGNRVIVPTHCVTSGGDIIHVTVEGGINAFKVHDDGAAVRIFENSGGELITAPKMLSLFLKDQGLNVDGFGAISAPLVSLDELAPSIVLVANAARDAAEHLIHRWKPAFKRKFKDTVRDLLEEDFPKRWEHDRSVLGHSNKPQKFDFAIDLGHERKLFFDAVVPDQNSISTAVVRHLDVARAKNESVVQRIVYDDRVEWKASDINLLKMGAPTLPFSQARQVFERIAA